MKKEKYIKVKTYKKSTYYTVQFSYDVAGEKHTYSKTFSSMKDAVKHRDLKRAELITSGLPSGKRTMEQLLGDLHRLNRCPISTQKRNKVLFNHFPEYHQYLISEIKPIDIQRSLNAMIYDYSNDEISRTFGLWKRLCDTAILEGFINVSPCGRVILPKSKKIVSKRAKVGSDEDFEKIINYLRTERDSEELNYNNQLTACALMIMYYTGMRPAEVMALTRDSIDLKNHVIHVTASVGSDEEDDNVVRATKTETSRRDVPMTVECELNARLLLAMSANDRLFTLYNGTLPRLKYLSAKVNRIANVLGIDFHPYMLRHRAASKLIIDAKADPRTVMELLGHSSVQTTLGIYSHSNIGEKTEVIESLVETGRKTS